MSASRRRPLDLFKMAGDPKFISGIYNYCDRWCERCPMTAHCLVYAQEQAARPTDEARDVQNQAFWDALAETFAQTAAMLKEEADRRGIDLTMTAEEEQDYRRKERTLRGKVRRDPVNQLARNYLFAVKEWFDRHKDVFEKIKADLVSSAEMGLPGHDPLADAQDLADATEIVNWYFMQIAVKLERALRGREMDGDDEPDDPELAQQMAEIHKSDADGSAKVALIGIDRSLAAWGRVRHHLPEQGDEILDLLVMLDRLRRKVEAKFPDARAFRRPGFDDPPASKTKIVTPGSCSGPPPD